MTPKEKELIHRTILLYTLEHKVRPNKTDEEIERDIIEYIDSQERATARQ